MMNGNEKNIAEKITALQAFFREVRMALDDNKYVKLFPILKKYDLLSVYATVAGELGFMHNIRGKGCKSINVEILTKYQARKIIDGVVECNKRNNVPELELEKEEVFDGFEWGVPNKDAVKETTPVNDPTLPRWIKEVAIPEPTPKSVSPESGVLLSTPTKKGFKLKLFGFNLFEIEY